MSSGLSAAGMQGAHSTRLLMGVFLMPALCALVARPANRLEVQPLARRLVIRSHTLAQSCCGFLLDFYAGPGHQYCGVA